jgi:hypothetical protein
MGRHDGHPADPADVNGELRSKHHARGSPGYYAQNFRGQKSLLVGYQPAPAANLLEQACAAQPIQRGNRCLAAYTALLFRAAPLGETGCLVLEFTSDPDSGAGPFLPRCDRIGRSGMRALG